MKDRSVLLWVILIALFVTVLGDPLGLQTLVQLPKANAERDLSSAQATKTWNDLLSAHAPTQVALNDAEQQAQTDKLKAEAEKAKADAKQSDATADTILLWLVGIPLVAALLGGFFIFLVLKFEDHEESSANANTSPTMQEESADNY